MVLRNSSDLNIRKGLKTSGGSVKYVTNGGEIGSHDQCLALAEGEEAF